MRSIRLFISSTFRDMHAERDYLNRFVFPELRSRCLLRGAEFVGIDLRWGVTAEEAERRGALEICLAEIDGCRPFFLGLLGERYGWVPSPEEIPTERFWEIRQRPSLPEEKAAMLDEWYWPDETHQPPVVLLRRDRPIPGDVAEALIAFWEGEALSHAGESITEREIEYGALEAIPPARALFYFREPPIHAHPDFPEWLRSYFLESNPDRQKKLEALKRRIRAQAGLNVQEYQVRFDGLRIDPSLLPAQAASLESFADGVFRPSEWPGLSSDLQAALRQHGTVALAGQQEWGARVLEDLWTLIEPGLQALAAPVDAQEQERAYHERFLAERNALFIGREDILARMMDYAAGEIGGQPLVVTGLPGSGKSSVLAVFARDCRDRFPHALVLPHFIGAAPGSKILASSLRSLCESLRRECDLADEVPTDPEKLFQVLQDFFEKAGAVKPVILVLDALNQLDPAGGSHTLHWFPFRLPPGTRLVASTLSGPILDRLEKRLPAGHILDVPLLPEDDRQSLIAARLALRSKRLAPYQVELLLEPKAHPDAGLPLYLIVAVEELALFGDFDALDQRLARLPPHLPELFDQVLGRLEADYGRDPVEAVLTWLGASRSGMLESEVLDLLAEDQPGFSHMRWVQFYRSLEVYLHPRDERQGSGLLDFYHDQLRQAVYRRYFDMEYRDASASQAYQAAHHRLAAYLRSIAYGGKPPHWQTARPRGLGELSYHLAYGGKWPELKGILTDFDFLQAKTDLFGPQTVIDDYNLALESDPDRASSIPNPTEVSSREGLHLIRDALQLSAHILDQDRDQLAGQLLARLLSMPNPLVQRLLEGARVWQGRTPSQLWLRPLAASLERPTGGLLRTLEGHQGAVWAAAITPDRGQILSGSDDHTLRAWDLDTGTCLQVFEGHLGKVWALAIAPKEGQVVSASADHTLKVWDIESGEAILPLEGHTGEVRAVAITQDEKRAVSASADGSLIIWDLGTGQRLNQLTGHNGAVLGVCLIDDGRAISISADRTLKVWDLETRQVLSSLEIHPDFLTPMAVTPDGHRAVTIQGDDLIFLDLIKGRKLRTLKGHGNQPTSVMITEDGKLCLSASADTTLRLWNLNKGRLLRTLRSHAGQVTAVAVDPNWRYAVSASTDKTVKVWDLAAILQSIPTIYEPQALPTERPDLIQLVAITADGRRAVSIGQMMDTLLQSWDMAMGKELFSPIEVSYNSSALAITHDGRQAVLAVGRAIEIWDLETGQKRLTLPGSGRIDLASVTPNGQSIVAVELSESRGGLLIWDKEGNPLKHSSTGQPNWRTILAMSSGGGSVLYLSKAGELKVWNPGSRRKARLLPAKISTTYTPVTALTADGRHAIIATEDNRLEVWNLEDLRSQLALSGHSGRISAIAVTPDGRWAVSGSEDLTVRVWNLWNGQVVATFYPSYRAKSCAISADGRSIVVGDQGGWVHLMKMEGGMGR